MRDEESESETELVMAEVEAEEFSASDPGMYDPSSPVSYSMVLYLFFV